MSVAPARHPGHSSSLRRFWRWWLTELRHLFLIRSSPPARPRREVRIVDGEAVVTNARGREISRHVLLPDAGDTIRPGKRLSLILPDDAVILRTRDMPRRAEAELSQVIDYQFDAHIPLRREDCFAAHRIVARNGDTLSVQIAAAPRGRVDEARRALSQVGLSPSWVGRDDVPLNLLDDGAPRGSIARGWLAAGLICCAAAILIAAAWAPALRLQSHNDALQVRADAAMSRATAALRQRQDVEALEERLATLDAFSKPTGVLADIAALAAAIGDDTTLASLAYDGETFVVSAQTPDPATLMRTISGIDGLRTPELTSPEARQLDGRARVTLAIGREDAP